MKNLIGLQQCDTRIRDINKKRELGPLKIEILKNELKLVEEELEKEINQCDAYYQERRQVEQTIEDLEHRTEKSNIKLANIKSNKEYGAALKEIEDLQREKSLSEDRVLEIMEKIDALEAQRADIEAKREDSRKKFEKGQREVREELEALNRGLEICEEKQSGLCAKTGDDLLKQYDYLKEHKEGIAVSPVIKGVCQTCHMAMPPQKFNELMRGDDIMSCPHCQRIIYWSEDKRFQGIVEKN
ncbi:MAG: hypothetical protein GY864_05450 [Desulfobacterales bacterium]|nr:hypothetical protein [Desulfobacterales bacterium]